MNVTGFYLMDTTTDKFVALDSASGGYPCMVEGLHKAEKFHTVGDAMKYRNSSLSDKCINAKAWKAVTLELIATEAETFKLSWEVVFNAQHTRHGHIGLAFDLATTANYSFMMWNDRIYAVDTRREVVGAYVS